MSITRRTVLASTALAAAPIAGPALAQTASPPAPAQGAASRQALVAYRGNRYSVPPELAMATVTVTRPARAWRSALVTPSATDR